MPFQAKPLEIVGAYISCRCRKEIMTSINNTPVSADHSTANLQNRHKRAVDRLQKLSQDNRDIILKFDQINDVTFDNGLRTRTDKIDCLYRCCTWAKGR